MDRREVCKQMKRIREQLAKEHGIEGFEYKECTFEGECEGHCPACDEETALLTKLLSEEKPKFVKPVLNMQDDFLTGDIIMPEPKPVEPNMDQSKTILSGKIVQPMPKKKEDDNILMGLMAQPNYDEDPFDRDRASENIWNRMNGKIALNKEKKETYEDDTPNEKGISKHFKRKKK